MPVLSKLWGKWLYASQIANVLLMMLAAFGAGATEVEWLQQWKQHALELHATIAGVLATLQAVAKSLTDADGNGVPDLFEGKALTPPTPPAEDA